MRTSPDDRHQGDPVEFERHSTGAFHLLRQFSLRTMLLAITLLAAAFGLARIDAFLGFLFVGCMSGYAVTSTLARKTRWKAFLLTAVFAAVPWTGAGYGAMPYPGSGHPFPTLITIVAGNDPTPGLLVPAERLCDLTYVVAALPLEVMTINESAREFVSWPGSPIRIRPFLVFLFWFGVSASCAVSAVAGGFTTRLDE